MKMFSLLLKVKFRLIYQLQKIEKTHKACSATQQGRLHRAVCPWIAPDPRRSILTHHWKAESLQPTMERMKLVTQRNWAHTASIWDTYHRKQCLCFSRAPHLDPSVPPWGGEAGASRLAGVGAGWVLKDNDEVWFWWCGAMHTQRRESQQRRFQSREVEWDLSDLIIES